MYFFRLESQQLSRCGRRTSLGVGNRSLVIFAGFGGRANSISYRRAGSDPAEDCLSEFSVLIQGTPDRREALARPNAATSLDANTRCDFLFDRTGSLTLPGWNVRLAARSSAGQAEFRRHVSVFLTIRLSAGAANDGLLVGLV